MPVADFHPQQDFVFTPQPASETAELAELAAPTAPAAPAAPASPNAPADMPAATRPRCKAGRPRALDETKRREICKLIALGFSRMDAAEFAGCAPSTIHRECRRDKSFRQALLEASLTSFRMPLRAIRKAGRTNWRAAAWMLERLNPEHFVRRNPQYLTLKQLRAALDAIGTIVREEADDDTYKRIFDRLGSVADDLDKYLGAEAPNPL